MSDESTPEIAISSEVKLKSSESASENGIWGEVDAVLIINLDGSSERWDKLTLLLNGVVPKEKIHRIPAVLGTDLPGYLSPPWFTARTGKRARTCAGAAGCVLSHAKALKYAWEHEDWQVILILEDDARLDVESLDGVTSQLRYFINNYPNWELVYAGYHGKPKYEGRLGMEWEFPNIYRCSGVLGTFGMLMHRQAWEEILNQLPEEKDVWSWIAQYKAIDYWLKHWYSPFHEVFYVSSPFISCAEDLVSDISGNLPQKISSHASPVCLDAWEWKRRYSFFRKFFLKLNMHFDRLIRWVKIRTLGYSGGRQPKHIKKV